MRNATRTAIDELHGQVQNASDSPKRSAIMKDSIIANIATRSGTTSPQCESDEYSYLQAQLCVQALAFND